VSPYCRLTSPLTSRTKVYYIILTLIVLVSYHYIIFLFMFHAYLYRLTLTKNRYRKVLRAGRNIVYCPDTEPGGRFKATSAVSHEGKHKTLPIKKSVYLEVS